MLNYENFLNENSKDSTNEKFVEKRKSGAAEIASKAAAKAGFAKLTAWHFKAKLPQYEICHKAIEQGKPNSFFENKFKELLSKINSGMNQKNFQETMGELEVWGEVLIQLKKEVHYG
jgi:hypothetical protein